MISYRILATNHFSTDFSLILAVWQAVSRYPFPSSGTRRKCDGGRLSIKSRAGPTTEHWIRDSWRARHRLEPIHAADTACAANRRDVRSVEYFSRSQRDVLPCLSPSRGLLAARYRHDFGPLGCIRLSCGLRRRQGPLPDDFWGS